MPFIPNEPDAAFPDQAEPDAGDYDILANGSIGVVSGCAVTAQATPDMTVAVASGRVVAGALPGVDVTTGNLTIGAANATNARFDLISVNSSGVKAVIAGTASTDPVFPPIPASTVILAAIYIPAADSAINANQICDKRAYMLEPALLIGATPVRLPTFTGWWGFLGHAGVRANTYAQDDGRMFLFPAVFDRSTTLVALGPNITNTPASPGTTRMVVYGDSSGRPGSRLAHALIAAITSGVQLATVNLAVTAGTIYWVGMVNEGAGATRVGWQELDEGRDLATLPAPDFAGGAAKAYRFDITAGSTPPADLSATDPSTVFTIGYQIVFDV